MKDDFIFIFLLYKIIFFKIDLGQFDYIFVIRIIHEMD
jgi:hypothetical protein